MDAEAVGAALTPAALAPPIADSLGLSVEAVTAALVLLADGAQPVFVARYRPERTKTLSLRDLERIQALAAQAVAFEFKRQELVAEVKRRKLDRGHLLDHLRSARELVDLDDVRSLFKRRRRGPAAKARSAGLGRVARALWTHACPPEIVERIIFFNEHDARGEGPATGDEAQDDDVELVELVELQHDAGIAPSGFDPESDARHDDADLDGAEFVSSDEPSDDVSEIESVGDESIGVAATATAEDGEPLETSAPSGTEWATTDEVGPGTEEAPVVVHLDPTEVEASITADSIGDFPHALGGARTICAEQMGDSPALRGALRQLLLTEAKLVSVKASEKGDKAGRYDRFANLSEPIARVPASTLLALHRAEREGQIRVDLEIETERVIEKIVTELRVDTEKAPGEELLRAAEEAWRHGLGKTVRAGVRKVLKRRADLEAIAEFSGALRPLMMAPAYGPKAVLAIDAGHQNGCRVAMLDGQGRIVADDTIFPLPPKLQVPQAKARIAELCTEHHATGIVVTSGSGGRDVERMCRELVRETEALQGIVVMSLDADTAALHASSRAAKDEFREADAALRRCVAAGRRVQDPLLALIQIDPRKLGLGQHQHEVDQEELRTALEQVMVSCVSEVSIDLNAVGPEVLPWVAGMSHALGKAVVGFREAKGRLRSRAELLEIPGFAGKAFEQAAGFLRVFEGDNPLDTTMIHPERYSQITEMTRDLGVTVKDLIANDELIAKLEPERYLGKTGISREPLGRDSYEFLVEELHHPGRDPRPPFCTAEFHPDLKEFEDLKVGMELEGLVTHLASFGAFVDVGIAQEGLVHVSELSHGFISSPLEAVYVGQKVKGRVIEISPDRKRFSLSLKALLPRPERPAKNDGKPNRRRNNNKPNKGEGAQAKGKGGRGGPGKGRDDRQQQGGGNKQRPKERTLGFRLDLSELAERLEKG